MIPANGGLIVYEFVPGRRLPDLHEKQTVFLWIGGLLKAPACEERIGEGDRCIQKNIILAIFLRINPYLSSVKSRAKGRGIGG